MSRNRGDHVDYMLAKKAKLSEQFIEEGRVLAGDVNFVQIFAGVRLYVNGYTIPPAEELKHLIIKHGGSYSTFLDSSVTHMIANNLPDCKKKLYKKIKVVKPEWLIYSIKSGKQLQCADYLTINPLKDQFIARRSVCHKGSEDHSSLGQDSCEGTDHAPEVVKSSESCSNVQNETSRDSRKGATLGADIDSFYNKSRLHFLSTMKMELKEYVSCLKKEGRESFLGLQKLRNWLEEKYEDSPGWKRSTEDCIDVPPHKVVMHLDMDCFFVSVACVGRPEFNGVPVVVTSSKISSASPQNWTTNRDSMADIACCSYEARAKGVKNGMRVGMALQICPNLVAVPYEFEKYRSVSKKLYEIVTGYTLHLEAVSCDEMYIDCTNVIEEVKCTPVDFAEHIRQEVKEHTGCSASAGIGSNRILARMATRKAKPNGIFYLEPDIVEQFMKDIQLRDLPGIGPMLNRKLSELNVHTCGQLKSWPMSKLESIFGMHTGKKLFNNCRGIEMVALGEGDAETRKSVSSEINYGIRFTELIEAEETLNNLSKIVSSKMADLKGKSITLKLKIRSADAPVTSAKFLGHGICDNISRTTSLDVATSDPDVIFKVSVDILKKIKVSVGDIRGLGIMVNKLESGNSSQRKESISHFFQKPKNKDFTSKVTRDVAPKLVGDQSMVKRVVWKEPEIYNLCLERNTCDNLLEGMGTAKIVQSHFESYFISGKLPDRQLKETVLCILLHEVAQLNIASVLSCLTNLNRSLGGDIKTGNQSEGKLISMVKYCEKVYLDDSQLMVEPNSTCIHHEKMWDNFSILLQG